MTDAAPRAPVALAKVLDDPSIVRRIAERCAPYAPVQRYFQNASEQEALSQNSGSAASRSPSSPGDLFVAPWFRGDWAYDRPLVDGIEPILESPILADAARQVFGGAVVRPQIVYANLMLSLPDFDLGHTDIPAFRGIDRTRYPVWLLTVMGRSGLFERWRVRIATAVSWWFEGEGGGFTYWPDGPDARPRTVPPAPNTAVVGDNDFMFHRVERVGPPKAKMARGLTLESRLVWHGGGDWSVMDADRELVRTGWRDVRLSVSWKAQVFEDETDLRRFTEHSDDLDLDTAVGLLVEDLRARGRDAVRPADPLADPAFIEALTGAYRRTPTVYPEPVAA